MTRQRLFVLLMVLLIRSRLCWGGLLLAPLLIGILSFAAAQLNEVWSYALGSAIFFGWMLAAAFPMAG